MIRKRICSSPSLIWKISCLQIIFNTIPHLIMDRKKLLRVDKRAVIIDLSSYPGGVDFNAARELNLKASLDLGLPGKVAPKTAAEIIIKVMMDSLQERMT